MTEGIEIYRKMKDFLALDDADSERLRALRPIIEHHGPGITDEFYEVLARFPETQRLVAGRVDQLKQTHRTWMLELVGGDYGDAYFASRWRIGLAHVRIGLDPFWPEAVMSLIRARLLAAIARELSTPDAVAAHGTSLLKVCDLDLLVINLSYAEDRLERLTSFTGMKRSLLENIIRISKA